MKKSNQRKSKQITRKKQQSRYVEGNDAQKIDKIDLSQSFHKQEHVQRRFNGIFMGQQNESTVHIVMDNPSQNNLKYRIFEDKIKNQIQNIQKLDEPDQQKQAYKEIKEISLEMIKLSQSDPDFFYQSKSLREQVKSILKKCEDNVNFQKILKRQIFIVRKEIQKNSELDTNIQNLQILQLSVLLHEQGNRLAQCSKYSQAVIFYEESLQSINGLFGEKSQVREPNIKDKSFVQKVKSWFKNNQNQRPNDSDQSDQKPKQCKHTLQKYFELQLNVFISLLKCFNYLIDEKRRKQVVQQIKICLWKNELLFLDQQNQPLSFLLTKAKLCSLISVQDLNSQQQSKALFLSLGSLSEILQDEEKSNPESQVCATIHSVLADSKKSFLKRSLLQPTRDFYKEFLQSDQQYFINNIYHIYRIEKRNFQWTKSFNQQFWDTMVTQSKTHYEATLKIKQKKLPRNSQEILDIRNRFSEFLYQTKQTDKAIYQVLQTLENPRSKCHSSGSKAYLLLGRISFSRGNLKTAFESTNKSNQVLKKALLKQQTDNNYRRVFIQSQIYREIELMRVKIYNKQNRHDLAIKTLDFLTPKQNPNVSLSFVADILQQKARTIALSNPQNVKEYEKLFKKAVQLRTKRGQSNMENAITYCTLAKYLICFDRKPEHLEKGKQYLEKSLQIFKRFPHDHPNHWIPFLLKAELIEAEGGKYQLAQEYIQISRRLVIQRFGKYDINAIKVRVQEARIKEKCGDHEKKIYILGNIKKTLQSLIKKEKEGKLENIFRMNELGLGNGEKKGRNLLINDEKQLLLKMIEKSLSKDNPQGSKHDQPINTPQKSENQIISNATVMEQRQNKIPSLQDFLTQSNEKDENKEVFESEEKMKGISLQQIPLSFGDQRYESPEKNQTSSSFFQASSIVKINPKEQTEEDKSGEDEKGRTGKLGNLNLVQIISDFDE